MGFEAKLLKYTLNHARHKQIIQGTGGVGTPPVFTTYWGLIVCGRAWDALREHDCAHGTVLRQVQGRARALNDV